MFYGGLARLFEVNPHHRPEPGLVRLLDPVHPPHQRQEDPIDPSLDPVVVLFGDLTLRDHPAKRCQLLDPDPLLQWRNPSCADPLQESTHASIAA
jgi:hypothetical protein